MTNTLNLTQRQINELISMSHELDNVKTENLNIITRSTILGASMAIKELCLGYDAKSIIEGLLR